MMQGRKNRWSLVLGFAWGLSSLGCAQQAPKADGTAGEGSGGEIGTLERRIASVKSGLHGGVARGGGGDAAPAAAPSSGGDGGSHRRCDAVCQAANEICTCHRRICFLADELKDGRSADSCRRAQRDCEEAAKLCAGCGG